MPPQLVDPPAGLQVQAYRNLRWRPQVLWSLRCPTTRRLVGHVRQVVLVDVTLRVSQAGQARGRRDGVRNVHAFADGTVAVDVPGRSWRAATYDPFRDAGFVEAGGRVPDQVAAVRLCADGTMWWLPVTS